MFKVIHISSDNLFHKRQPFTENALSGASAPTSGIRNLNLCSLVLLLLASLTNFIKSNKYNTLGNFYEQYCASSLTLQTHGVLALLKYLISKNKPIVCGGKRNIFNIVNGSI
jgi:hypothetical protein